VKKLGLYILLASFVFCGVYVGKTTMDYTITTRNLVWIACTIILFVSISMRAINGEAIDLSIGGRLIFVLFLGLAFISILSLTRAANIGEGIYESCRWFVMAVCLFVTAVTLNENNINKAIKVIILLALGLGIFGIYQYFKMPANPATRIGTMANMNLCSSSHLLMIPFSVYAIMRYSKIWKILGLITVVTALFIILFSLRTRSTWVAMSIGLLAATFHRKKMLIASLAIIIVMGISIYAVKGERIFSTSSMKQRKDLWSQSLVMAKDHPLGVGSANWRVVIPFYSRYFSDTTREVAFKTIYFQRPHNDWVWVITELGVFGIALYVGVFLMGLYYAIKSRNPFLYAGIVAYIVIAMFSFPKERTFHTFIILIYLALSIKLYHKPIPLNLSRRTMYLTSLAVLSVLTFSAYVFCERYYTEKGIYRAIHAKMKKDWKNVYKETEYVSKYSTLDSYGTPIEYYKGISNYQRGRYDDALDNFKQAIKENPNHIYVLMNLGACYVIHQQFQEAKKCYEKVIHLYPDYEHAKVCYEATAKSIKAKGTNNEKGNVINNPVIVSPTTGKS